MNGGVVGSEMTDSEQESQLIQVIADSRAVVIDRKVIFHAIEGR